MGSHQTIKAFFISLEFVILLTGASLILSGPAIALEINPNATQWLAAAQVAMGVWIFTEGNKILFPEDRQDMDTLHKWPDYKSLKSHYIAAMIYAAIFILIGCTPWIFNIKIPQTSTILTLTGVIGQFMNALSVFLARISIREILLSNPRK